MTGAVVVCSVNVCEDSPTESFIHICRLSFDVVSGVHICTYTYVYMCVNIHVCVVVCNSLSCFFSNGGHISWTYTLGVSMRMYVMVMHVFMSHFFFYMMVLVVECCCFVLLDPVVLCRCLFCQF